MTDSSLRLAEFEASLKRAKRPAPTIVSYLAGLRHFGRWLAAAHPEAAAPTPITPSEVQAYRDHLLQRGMNSSTINHRLSAIAAYARWESNAQLPEAPIRRLFLAPLPRAEPAPTWLSPRERRALQSAVEAHLQKASAHSGQRRALWQARDAHLMVILLNTGLRVDELVNLNQSDVQLTPQKGRLTVHGHGAKKRVIPLNSRARTAMDQWLKLRPDVDTSAIFVSQFRTRMTTRTVERVVTDFGRRAKLQRLTPQTIRHTFGRRLAEKGIAIDRVAALMVPPQLTRDNSRVLG